MDDALLDLRLGITGGNGLREAGQIVHTGDQNVLNATVLQLIEYTQTVFGRLMLADPHAQHVLVAIQIDPDDHVGSLIHNSAILLHFEMNVVQKDNGVDALQRPILPFLDEGHDFIRHIGDKRR